MTIMSTESSFPSAEAVLGKEVEVSKADLKEFVHAGIVKKIDNHKEHFAIQPCWMHDPGSGVMEEINCQTLGRWNKKLKAYVVAVHNIRNGDTTAGLNEDHNWLHVDISATYYTYAPEEEQILTGVVQKIGNRAAVCSLFDVFTATVFAKDNDELNSWQVGERVEFKVYSFIHRRKGPIIRGKSLTVFNSHCDLNESSNVETERDIDTAEPSMASAEVNGDGERDEESFETSTKSKKKKKRRKHDEEDMNMISDSHEDRGYDDADQDSSKLEVESPIKKKKKKKKSSRESE